MPKAQQLDNFIKASGLDVFIEAEGRPSRLSNFYTDYNSSYDPAIDNSTDGIIVLEEDANKWGLELRLYLHEKPNFVPVTRNTVYRSEYSYRINDVDLIWNLFALGYRIGLNSLNQR